MLRRINNDGKAVGSTKAFKRIAAMLDIIALAASLILILAACAASKPERSSTADTSPALSDSPPVTSDISTDTTPPEALYPEYAPVNIYRDDSREFIRLASQLDSSQIDNIAQLICYDLSLDKDTVIPQLESYRKGGGLNEMEQLVVSDILRYFALWYVD